MLSKSQLSLTAFFAVSTIKGATPMIKSKWSAIITIGLCGLVIAALTTMIFIMPSLTDWYYSGIRKGAAGDGKPLLYAFYCCVPAAFLAIYHLMRLLINVHNGNVFVVRNVTYLRYLAWCCAWVSAATFVAGCFYMPLLIVSFAAVFVCLLIRVIRHILAAAVDIKNENELTI